MYIRNEIFDNTIKEEIRRRREVKGEIDEPIKSDLIYKFDNNGDFLGIKRSHQKKKLDELKIEEKVMCRIPWLVEEKEVEGVDMIID